MAKKDKKGVAERLDALMGGGDYRAARREAERLAASADTPEVDRNAAREFRERRLSPEPGALLVAGLSFALILFVIYFGLLRH